MKYQNKITSLAVVSLVTCDAFVPHTHMHRHTNTRSFLASPRSSVNDSRLWMSSSSTLPDIDSMRVSELKKELESYGLSTKSYFEKSELTDALKKARAEGKVPLSSSGSDSSSTSSSSESNSTSSTSESSREDRLKQEIEKCQAMKAGELKKELESYGISTASFFEKSEFVKACAEARVDGASANKASSSSSSSGGEGYAEYTNVEVLTDDDAGPRKRSSEQDQGAQSSNPFGGGMPGGMPSGMPGGMGGMGGMGGIADMMKNMGMGGAAAGGANPFGGMGGMGGANPFGGTGGMGGMGGMGDQMKKAQEMMSNPKVQQIMAKAQKNPKVMAAVQECMGNPMAFAKYQNDPEIGQLIRELQQYM